MLSGGEGSPPLPGGYAFPVAAQDAVGLLCHEGALLSHVQPAACSDTCVFPCKAPPCCSEPSLYWYMGLFFPRCGTLHFPLSSFMRFLSAHFSSLPSSLLVAAPRCGEPGPRTTTEAGMGKGQDKGHRCQPQAQDGFSHAERTEPEGREARRTRVHKAIYPTAMHGYKNANTLRKATREAAA